MACVSIEKVPQDSSRGRRSFVDSQLSYLCHIEICVYVIFGTIFGNILVSHDNIVVVIVIIISIPIVSSNIVSIVSVPIFIALRIVLIIVISILAIIVVIVIVTI